MTVLIRGGRVLAGTPAALQRADVLIEADRIAAAAILIACCGSFTAYAEQSELRIAKQYGLGYLQMMVMEDQKIIEKKAKAAGLSTPADTPIC